MNSLTLTLIIAAICIAIPILILIAWLCGWRNPSQQHKDALMMQMGGSRWPSDRSAGVRAPEQLERQYGVWV
ncbi:hypothetical protein OCU04_000357 [Sclerotinia nivalis]|uniref:Uncharacterized protein n=1 Tax=Sclerotinia nivalis TaxID=352851 RepID=A0A9X0AVY2_9HELO|nr:hypothetical protein OCU04_000357 [Sclerotinia nivalis]